MHFQKLYAVICVASLFVASGLTVKADDTEAQAKAREALRKAMEDQNAQKGASKPAAPKVKETPAPAPAPAPTPAPAPAPKPEPVAPPPAPVSPPPAAVAPAPAPAPSFTAPQSRLTPEEQEKVLEAMRQEKAKLDAADHSTAKAKAPAPVIKNDNTGATPDPKKMAAKSGANPPPPPADMVPGSKEQRLYELLQKYKADQITPAEYHQQRAKIIAE